VAGVLEGTPGVAGGVDDGVGEAVGDPAAAVVAGVGLACVPNPTSASVIPPLGDGAGDGSVREDGQAGRMLKLGVGEGGTGWLDGGATEGSNAVGVGLGLGDGLGVGVGLWIGLGLGLGEGAENPTSASVIPACFGAGVGERNPTSSSVMALPTAL
jgi:hypothetical protein